jgi:hypothetical protein
MPRTAGDSPRPEQKKIPVQELKHYLAEWNLESQLRGHTSQSILSPRDRIGKFFWFLEHKRIEDVRTPEIKQLFLYFNEFSFTRTTEFLKRSSTS